MHQLLPACALQGVEINAKACEQARELGIAEIWQGSLFDYPRERTFDLTLSKGVLIHLAPRAAGTAYEQLYTLSGRYILIAEYYNPVPVEVSYRGNSGKLFKRDFAGEMLDRYPDLQLLDYGFSYHRDPQFRPTISTGSCWKNVLEWRLQSFRRAVAASASRARISSCSMASR